MAIVYPKTTGWVAETVFITEGEPWDSNDPFVKAHPEHFSGDPGQSLRGSGRVEAATAEPGEQRDVAPADDKPPLGGPGSGREAWATYAEAHGVDVTDDMTRDEIIEALEG